ncbi:MAG: hypothetical protein R2865_16545 [Deinococcales bacterium]
MIFTQFADTVAYLERELTAKGLSQLAAVTGDSDDPTELAWRFSPKSNRKEIDTSHELRVLIATDVLRSDKIYKMPTSSSILICPGYHSPHSAGPGGLTASDNRLRRFYAIPFTCRRSRAHHQLKGTGSGEA